MLLFSSLRTRVPSAWLETLWVDVALSAATFVLALAVRLPNLMLVPAYTDEGAEVLWALDIAQGHHFPLTAVDSYDGPFFSYLVAALFRLFGVSAEIPRLLALISGALTVVAVYWLARLMLNRLAGLVAAGLALTSPILVIYTSHLGWSSSLTPFFAMATAVALYAGVTRDKTWLLASSGLLAALTLQTHPTSLTGLVGILLWFLTRPAVRQWLTRPALYIGLGLGLLGYSPMILANLGLGSPVLNDAVQRTYAFAPTLDPPEYIRRLIALARIAGFYVGGGIGSGTTLMRIIAVAAEIVLLIGIVLMWRSKNRLIPTVFLTSLLLIPFIVVSDSYRYFGYVIPMSYVVFGILAAGVIRQLFADQRHARAIRILRRPALVACVIALVGFVGISLDALCEFYSNAFASGLTNEGYFRLAAQVRDIGACGSTLFVQAPTAGALESADTIPSDFAYENVGFVLTMSNCAHALLNRGLIVQQLSNSGQSGWVIASAVDVQDYKERLNLSPISTIHPVVFTTITPMTLYQAQPIR